MARILRMAIPMPLTRETQLYWAACQALRTSDNRRNTAATRRGIDALHRLALHAASVRIRRAAVYAMRAAERANNTAIRRAVQTATRTERPTPWPNSAPGPNRIA